MTKRVFDLVTAALALMLLSPVLLLVAVAVLAFLGRPVFYVQSRPGLHGCPFRIWKFRTMLREGGANGTLLTDAERLIPFGRFLRATSLDELPELWNVLVGDMSLVGPRPLLMEYLSLYTPEQARRHEVRPGITGWAQVNGRNSVAWDERLRLDVWYVDNRSFLLDLRILWRTVRKVLARDGISHGTEATMPRFTGSSGRAS